MLAAILVKPVFKRDRKDSQLPSISTIEKLIAPTDSDASKSLLSYEERS